jgi:hypothetical protein
VVKLTDILIAVFLGLAYLISACIIVTSDWFADNIPYSVFVIFLLLIAFIAFEQTIKGTKKVTPFVQSFFDTKGLKVINERPLTLAELFFTEKVTFKVEPVINKIPLSRFGYIRKFKRVFSVTDKDRKSFELRAEVTLNWDRKVTVEIEDRT